MIQRDLPVCRGKLNFLRQVIANNLSSKNPLTSSLDLDRVFVSATDPGCALSRRRSSNGAQLCAPLFYSANSKFISPRGEARKRERQDKRELGEGGLEIPSISIASYPAGTKSDRLCSFSFLSARTSYTHTHTRAQKRQLRRLPNCARVHLRRIRVRRVKRSPPRV